MIKTPYRAEHVGSLLRPAELLDARDALADGRITGTDLRAIEDRAIEDALQRQRETGLDILSDGEMRRGSWLTDMADAVDGFVENRVLLEWRGPSGAIEATTAKVAGERLRKTRKLAAHELPFLQARAAGRFKLTLPAPSNFMFASYKAGISDRIYPTRESLLDDLVAITRDEVQWLVDAGVSYVQFDAPYYSHYLDQRQRARMQAEGVDPDAELAHAIAGDNAAFAGVSRADTTFAVHVCRGNNQSRWYTEGAYDAIAERLFATLNVDTFLLEYDDQRSGGFEPLRLVPATKNVVLGLVTTKQPALESVDALCRRVDQAARYIPLERLAISPQCGFASVARGNRLSADDQWCKLQLVADVARRVWGP
jgi:5-methyltetrahydropteroyltriglutamate--homocysteine methyltransferase